MAIVAGAVVRLVTLDLQSFSHDEAVTALHVLQPSLADTLEAVAERERSGPLYYTLAWAWWQASGVGVGEEVVLRSLSAVLGALTIPVAYLAARELGSHRAGVIAAALVALNPFLIWYSQEARAYALVVLLSALSLLFLARALKRESSRGRELALWAAASAGALATHYFAVFAVVPEALWLLYALRSWGALASVTVTGAAGVALLPLLTQQEGQRSGLFADTTLFDRLAESAAKFSVGNELSLFPKLAGVHVPAAALSAGAAALWLAGIALLVFDRGRWGGSGGRRDPGPGGLLAAGIGLLALGLPLVLALAGTDLINARNLIGAVVPLLIAAGAGFAARRSGRAGPVAGAILCGVFAASLLLVLANPSLQRPDFRGVADALGAPRGPRAVLSSRLAVPQLSLYTDAERVRGGGLPTVDGEPVLRPVEIAVVAPGGGKPDPSLVPGLRPAPRFRPAGKRDVPGYDVYIYRSDQPLAVEFDALSRVGAAGREPAVLMDGDALR